MGHGAAARSRWLALADLLCAKAYLTRECPQGRTCTGLPLARRPLLCCAGLGIRVSSYAVVALPTSLDMVQAMASE
jgi:hypothetical protein